MPHLFRQGLWWVNAGLLAAALLGIAAPYLSPHVFSWPTWVAYAQPWPCVLLLPFLLYHLLERRSWPWLLVHLVVLLASLPSVTHHYQPRHSATPRHAKGAIQVASVNVGAFLYGPHHQALKQYLACDAPDILCVQEYLADFGRVQPSYHSQLLAASGYRYHAFRPLVSHFGLAIFSRYPILRSGMVTPVGRAYAAYSNGIMYADVQVGQDTVRIYNVHLPSYKLSMIPQDHQHEQQETPEQLLFARSLLARMQAGWQQQHTHLALLQAHRSSCQYPTLICGDLNNTPGTYAYHAVADGMQDAFVQAGSGWGHSYGRGLLRLRIDFIFASAHFHVLAHQQLQQLDTDHAGQWAALQLQQW